MNELGRWLWSGCLLLCASSALSEPLPTHDQNPLLAGFGLPRPMPSRDVDHWQWNADLNWGSSAIIQDRAAEHLIVDAESRELRFTLSGKLADNWLFAGSVPWRSTSAGSLDGFIDSWHDFFNLPVGKRNELPRDDLRILYRDSTARRIDRSSSLSGAGDLDLALGRPLLATPVTALAGWLDVKLPTGDSSDLTGSGSLDVSLLVAGEYRFGDRWSIFGQAGITRLGEGDFLPEKQRDWVGSAMAGASRRLWRTLDLTVQLDAHTAAFDSALDYLGDTVILEFGGAWHFRNGLQVSLGISEDIIVEASPDVVFVVGVSKAL